MIIMPSTPIIFRLAFIVVGEVMEHSTKMRLTILDDIVKMLFRVSANFGVSIIINLYS